MTATRSLPAQAWDLERALRPWPEDADTLTLYRWILIHARAERRYWRRHHAVAKTEQPYAWLFGGPVKTSTTPSRVRLAEELQSGRAARGCLGLEPLADDRALLVWWLVRIGDDLGLVLKGRYPHPIPGCERAPWAQKGGNTRPVQQEGVTTP